MKFDFFPAGRTHQQRESRHSLDRILSTGVGLALFSTICLSLVIVSRSYLDFVQAQRNHDHLQAYRLILDAANIISAERSPANTSMSLEPGDLQTAEKLAAMRARGDRALAKISALPTEYAIPSTALDEVHVLLTASRQAVDKVAAMPRRDRSLAAIGQAVDSMFAVVDRLGRVIDWRAKQMISQDASLAGPAIIGRSLGELREYGGRVGSLLRTPMAIDMPVSIQTVADIHRAEGRVTALWQVINTMPDLAQPQFLREKQEAERLFFGEGLALVQTLITEGNDLKYSISSPAFTARYVPTMRPLETLRAGYLDTAVLRASQARDHAVSALLTGVLTTALIILLLVGIIVTIRSQVFRPLMRAQQAILRLAEDKPDIAASTHGTREIGQLFTAIDGLRAKLAERKMLTQRLRELAETDSLTGLANRRILDLIGQGLDNGRFAGPAVGLILLDIDHFKSINDTYGHMIGDQALVEMARLLRASLRSGDLVARYGGEEFAILVRDGHLPDLLALARKIRVIVQNHQFGMVDDTPLRLTVSCGVASGERTIAGWGTLVKDADDALYRAKAEGRNNVRQAPEAPPTSGPISLSS